MITAHFHTYRAHCRWVKESAAVHVSGGTGSLIQLWRRCSLTPARSGKVNGRAGSCLPNRFNELCKRRVHSFTSSGWFGCQARWDYSSVTFKILKNPERKNKSRPFEGGGGRASDFEIKENPTWRNVLVKTSQVLVAAIWKMRKGW